MSKRKTLTTESLPSAKKATKWISFAASFDGSIILQETLLARVLVNVTSDDLGAWGRCRGVSKRWQKVTDKPELQPRIFEHEDRELKRELKSIYIAKWCVGSFPQGQQPVAWGSLRQNLRELSLFRLRLVNLDVLSYCETLEALHVSHGDLLEDISGLSSVKTLFSVEFMFCRGLKVLDPLAGLPLLKRIALVGCIGITKLEKLPAITHLEAQGCANINSLSLPSSLEEVILSGCNALQDISVLFSLSNLTFLVVPEVLATDEVILSLSTSLHWLTWQPSSCTFYIPLIANNNQDINF